MYPSGSLISQEQFEKEIPLNQRSQWDAVLYYEKVNDDLTCVSPPFGYKIVQPPEDLPNEIDYEGYLKLTEYQRQFYRSQNGVYSNNLTKGPAQVFSENSITIPHSPFSLPDMLKPFEYDSLGKGFKSYYKLVIIKNPWGEGEVKTEIPMYVRLNIE